MKIAVKTAYNRDKNTEIKSLKQLLKKSRLYKSKYKKLTQKPNYHVKKQN